MTPAEAAERWGLGGEFSIFLAETRDWAGLASSLTTSRSPTAGNTGNIA